MIRVFYEIATENIIIEHSTYNQNIEKYFKTHFKWSLVYTQKRHY